MGANVRCSTASLAVRLTNRLSRQVGRGSGTVVGGRVGLRLAPDLLAWLARGRTTVLVTGTNGKTTTTSMIARGWGAEVVTNSTGSNMPPGHVAAFASSSSTHAVLEVDEAWLPEVVRATHPRVVVLLNLSRDQLDRASEVRQLAERWRQVFSDSANAGIIVVANSNDPLVVYVADAAPRVRWCDVPTTWRADAVSCPKCTAALSYEVGRWSCSCGFAKPLDPSTVLRGELAVGATHLKLTLSLPGEFNRANAAMALTALDQLGVDVNEAAERISKIASVAGRFSEQQWNGHTLRLLLAKNPAGFEALLSTVAADDRDVWIAINARIADGRDPSWLYDVPFEQLRGHRVWCFGDRRLDLAARLEYARVEFVVVDDDTTIPPTTGPVQLIANYTAFSTWLARTQP